MNEDNIRQEIFKNEWHTQQRQPTIKESFQNVDEISIDLEFEYLGITKVTKQQKRTFKPSDRFYFKITCLNTECLYSTLDLESDILSMLNNGEDKRSGQQTCNGWQDFERFRAKNYHCLATMNYEVTIKYNRRA